MKLTNVKIGRKLGLLLGICVTLLVAITALALWGNTVIAKSEEDSRNRLIKSLMAERVTSGVNAVTFIMQDVVLARKKSFGEQHSELLRVRKEYTAALEEFKIKADTPKSRQHAADMDAMVRELIAINERILELTANGDFTGALKQLQEKTLPMSKALRAKAAEAEKWQQQLVDTAEHERQSIASSIWLALVLGCIAAAAVSSIGGVVVTRSIAKPLETAVAHLNDVATGDLTRDAPAEFQARGDEIGLLARAKQLMITNLRQMVQDVTGGVQQLSSSSAELSANSGQMSEGGRQASDKAHAVAAAAEQMTSNVASVAAGMEQTTTNLASVATATEQMTATIGEIAKNSEKARRITDEATRQAVRISEQMNQLGQAAQQIGKVTETITEISSQTNLLALNATIEAARAGSAGKGFAVVANEIKELAQQTASATEDIKSRIAGVQSSTTGGIAEIEKISHVIHEVSEIVATIAAAIEEQSTVTKDIARNIGEATTGVREANLRVAESSQVTQSIAQEIAGVDQKTREMSDGTDQVRASATDLSKLAETLKVTVGRFQVQLSR